MIKAIDAQQVIIQIDHAARVQQQHPEVQQQYIQIQTQEEKRLLRAKINNAEEANRARIRDEQRERPKREGQEAQKGAPDAAVPDDEGDPGAPSHPGHINITV